MRSEPRPAAPPPTTRTLPRPHGQRWGEGLDSVLAELQHDNRRLPHAANPLRRPRQQGRPEWSINPTRPTPPAST